MPAISETARSYNLLNSQPLASNKGGGSVLFFAAGYVGAAMEPIPVINGTHSHDERKAFSGGG
jgi:hypothetical protein